MSSGRHPLPVPQGAEKILRELSLVKASRKLGISTCTAHNWRKKLGIDVNREKAERRRRVAEDVIALQSLEQVAARWGLSRQRIYQMVKPYLELLWVWRGKCSRKASH